MESPTFARVESAVDVRSILGRGRRGDRGGGGGMGAMSSKSSWNTVKLAGLLAFFVPLELSDSYGLSERRGGRLGCGGLTRLRPTGEGMLIGEVDRCATLRFGVEAAALEAAP